MEKQSFKERVTQGIKFALNLFPGKAWNYPYSSAPKGLAKDCENINIDFINALITYEREY